jgi:hypothetical protein
MENGRGRNKAGEKWEEFNKWRIIGIWKQLAPHLHFGSRHKPLINPKYWNYGAYGAYIVVVVVK